MYPIILVGQNDVVRDREIPPASADRMNVNDKSSEMPIPIIRGLTTDRTLWEDCVHTVSDTPLQLLPKYGFALKACLPISFLLAIVTKG